MGLVGIRDLKAEMRQSDIILVDRMTLSFRLVVSEKLDPEAAQFQHRPAYRRILHSGDGPEVFLTPLIHFAFDAHADDVRKEVQRAIEVANTDGRVMRSYDQR